MKVVMGIEIQQKSQSVHKVAILALGMHRSGTSLLAGILDRLGCKGPNTSLAADTRNPQGYFESEPIFRLNDEILATAGTRWNDWQPLRDGWQDSPRFNEFRFRAAQIIQAEYGEASLIYLKDPRLCRLLPLWYDVLVEMGYAVSCIHTHRHPQDVAASLKARKNIEVEPSVGMLSWLRHILDAEAASRELPRIFTSYSDLLTNWQILSQRVEEVFRFTWPVSAHAGQDRIIQLVDPDLRHHGSDIETFLNNTSVPETFRETVRVFENWAKNGENEDDWKVLDQQRRNFDLSTSLLYAPVKALETATREMKTLTPHKAEVHTLSAQLTEADRQRHQLSSQNEQLHADLDQHRVDLEKAQAQIKDLSEKLGDSNTKLEQADAAANLIKSELEQDRVTLKETQVIAEARQVEIDELLTKLREAQMREASLSDEVIMWTDRIIDRDQRISKLQQDVDRYRREQAAKNTEVDNLSAKLHNMRSTHTHAIDNLHSIYKMSTSWKVSAPVRFIGRLVARCG